MGVAWHGMEIKKVCGAELAIRSKRGYCIFGLKQPSTRRNSTSLAVMITRHRLGRYGRRGSPLVRGALTCIMMAKNTIATMTAKNTRPNSAPSSSVHNRKHPIHYLHPSGLDYNGDFFNFTRGRFVRNEAHEMSQRPYPLQYQ
jgi:hypothetical protein